MIIRFFLLFVLQGLSWRQPKFNLISSGLLIKSEKKEILIFSKTSGFRHKSIEPAIAAITKAAEKRGWQVQPTEDPAYFNNDNLQLFKVVVFLSTTGNILTPDQKKAFEEYIENGGSYAGIHSASDTEHAWIWYDRLLGTHFKSHTLFPRHITNAEIITETADHTATKNLPKRWNKKDEWYNFNHNVRGKDHIQVLLSLNEASYSSIFPKRMGADHPISWTNVVGKGRMFYTGMGHNIDTYTDSKSMEHIMGGIEWAGNF